MDIHRFIHSRRKQGNKSSKEETSDIFSVETFQKRQFQLLVGDSHTRHRQSKLRIPLIIISDSNFPHPLLEESWVSLEIMSRKRKASEIESDKAGTDAENEIRDAILALTLKRGPEKSC